MYVSQHPPTVGVDILTRSPSKPTQARSDSTRYRPARSRHRARRDDSLRHVSPLYPSIYVPSDFPPLSAIGEALYLDLFRREQHVMAAYFATSGALDVVITVQMLLLLLRSNTSEYASTTSLIFKIVLFIVGSNFLTAAVTLSIAIVVRLYINHWHRSNTVLVLIIGRTIVPHKSFSILRGSPVHHRHKMCVLFDWSHAMIFLFPSLSDAEARLVDPLTRGGSSSPFLPFPPLSADRAY
jgi:hypothetical protein